MTRHKIAGFALGLALIGVSARGQVQPSSPPSVLVPMMVDGNDIQIYLMAIHAAAGQCGADHERACVVGFNEKRETEKLNAAMQAWIAANRKRGGH